jgi:hypothetical protein
LIFLFGFLLYSTILLPFFLSLPLFFSFLAPASGESVSRGGENKLTILQTAKLFYKHNISIM